MRYSAHTGKAAPLARGQSSEDSSRWKPLEAEHIEVGGQMRKWVEEILRDLDGGMAGSGRTGSIVPQLQPDGCISKILWELLCLPHRQ